MLDVLHISTSDSIGGSGRSAYKIHTGLKDLGLTSHMLVGVKSLSDTDIEAIAHTKRLKLLDRVFTEINDRLSWQYLHYPSSSQLSKHTWFHNADIVQMYNTHGGYFSHSVLPALSKKRPLVWRLSDMWPFTGHCSYSYDCDRWKTGCGSCPILDEHPKLRRDTTAFLWRHKEKIYKRSRIDVVAPSKWILRLAQESPLLGRFPVHWIPNGVDIEVFHPMPKMAVRDILGFKEHDKVVFFSAHVVDVPRKGGMYLKAALEILAQKKMDNVKILLVGERWGAKEELPFPSTHMGYVSHDLMMAMAYSAADVFVLPTLAENLPNGVIESMACGTPCVSFDIGGVPDAVRHKETGYLARYKDAEDLAAGIEYVLKKDIDQIQKMKRHCREVAVAEYSLELQAKRFAELYGEILNA